jgi:DUF218 domain
MTRKPIFILGFANSEVGELSPISLSRIEKAIEVQKKQPGTVIMATGGFDPRFNTSPLPHREHVHRELAARGVPFWPADQNDLLSKHTVDDARMIVAFANKHCLGCYAITTSTFHVPRCQFIFDCLETREVEMFSANDPSDLDPKHFDHESAALERLNAQGGVLIGAKLHPHPLQHKKPC